MQPTGKLLSADSRPCGESVDVSVESTVGQARADGDEVLVGPSASGSPRLGRDSAVGRHVQRSDGDGAHQGRGERVGGCGG